MISDLRFAPNIYQFRAGRYDETQHITLPEDMQAVTTGEHALPWRLVRALTGKGFGLGATFTSVKVPPVGDNDVQIHRNSTGKYTSTDLLHPTDWLYRTQATTSTQISLAALAAFLAATSAARSSRLGALPSYHGNRANESPASFMEE
jgi:hypothetical protein